MNQTTSMRSKILEYIQDHTAAHGFPPTVREIMNAVGLKTPSTVQFHLNAMQDAGLITRKDGAARSIVVNRASAKATNLDILFQLVTESKCSETKAQELSAWLTAHRMCDWYAFLKQTATV